MRHRLKRDYVSELDQFLQNFDREHPCDSLAKEHEILKHAKIARLRDATQHHLDETSSILWDKF
ncbi:MAG: hypothetical protein LRY67_00290 [Gammaproteobacteria bacterium]|nr:hypothetical protein [Gammaproteobacteria bacterium]MCD8524248.1 hypothetical protein [Gammaproteobacteria bacterium]